MRKFRVFLFPVLAVLMLALAISPAGAAGRPFVTMLAGANEVPGPDDPDGMGRALITVHLGLGRVCWWISVSNITLPATGAPSITHRQAWPAPSSSPSRLPMPAGPPEAARRMWIANCS